MDRIDVVDRLPGGSHEQVALGDPGRGRGRAILDATHEHAGTLREPDRLAQPARDVGRRNGDPQPRSLLGLAAGEGIDA